MDQDRRRELIESIKRQGLPGGRTPLPVVSLEEFFVGNDDLGSIGCNLLDEHPGVDGFYRTLADVRGRLEVQDVLIEIYEVEGDQESQWPFSERVYVLTSAAKPDVERWLAPLFPDDVNEGWTFGVPTAAPHLEVGVRVFGAWWD